MLEFEDTPPTKARTGDFTAFWALYPRKVGKLAAQPAYKKALRHATHDEIMEGVRRYLNGKRSYADWAHPTTWLNQGRWMDEPDTIDALKAGIVKGVFHGESLECIASNVKAGGSTWARYRYPRDVLEQCEAAGLITEEQKEEAL